MRKNITPQLSKDISYHPFGKTEFFIHQTVFDHRVKISSELYSFLMLIDGEKTLQVLVDEYNLKFKSFLTNDFVHDFLFVKLAKFGIIQNNAIEIRLNEKPNYLKLSFIVVNVKLVSKFTKYLKYLFSKEADCNNSIFS